MIWNFVTCAAALLTLLAGAPALAQSDSAAAAGGAVVETAPVVITPLETALQGKIEAARSAAQKQRLEAIAAHYAANQWQPIWTRGGAPTRKAQDMVTVINRAAEDGLHRQDYDADTLAANLAAGAEADLVELELHLATVAVSFAQHMRTGRTDPREVNREVVIYPQEISAEAILAGLRKTSNVIAYMRLLAPHTVRYERLRNGLARYRAIAESGGWTKIPDGEVLKPGMSDPRLPLIRQRLIEAEVLDADAPVADASTPYDGAIFDAVVEFQERTGLTPDGVVGPATLEQMNIAIEDRIATMELNMERNRWMQDNFGIHHIFANLADQVVKVVKFGKTVHAEVIQVGLPYHRTPVFSDMMEYVEINPYWNVPYSIAVNEYLPKLRANPGVLAAQKISLLSGGGQISAQSVNWSSFSKGNFPFRLRQEPGPHNALGRIKFMFPNDFNVYIHDTPAKSKFEATSRYFSHGCLRVRDPIQLGEVLLGEQGYDRARIEAVIASGKRTVVKLDNPIPVHVAYLTAWVNKDGSVHFRPDVYGRDKILAEALAKVRGL